MKRALAMLLALVMVLGMMSPAVYAVETETPTITLTTNAGEELAVGDTFTVSADLSGNTGFAALTIALSWNADVVSFTGFDVSNTITPNPTTNETKAILVWEAATNVTVDGNIFVANFEVVGTGDCEIALRDDKFEMIAADQTILTPAFDETAVSGLTVGDPIDKSVTLTVATTSADRGAEVVLPITAEGSLAELGVAKVELSGMYENFYGNHMGLNESTTGTDQNATLTQTFSVNSGAAGGATSMLANWTATVTANEGATLTSGELAHFGFYISDNTGFVEDGSLYAMTITNAVFYDAESNVIDTTNTYVDGGVNVDFPDYQINIAATENGTVTAPETAHRQDTVTLTVTPDEGYILDTLSVVDADGNSINVSEYTFNMPACDVTVTATFAAESSDGMIHVTAWEQIATAVANAADGDELYFVLDTDVTMDTSSMYQFPAGITITIDGADQYTLTSGASEGSNIQRQPRGVLTLKDITVDMGKTFFYVYGTLNIDNVTFVNGLASYYIDVASSGAANIYAMTAEVGSTSKAVFTEGGQISFLPTGDIQIPVLGQWTNAKGFTVIEQEGYPIASITTDEGEMTLTDGVYTNATGSYTGNNFSIKLASGEEAPVTYAWYEAGAESGEYTITTAEELAQFAAIVNGTDENYDQDTFLGKTVTLANDIDLSAVCGAEAGSWSAIGGAAENVVLNITSQEELDAALVEYNIIYDDTGWSYKYGTDKNLNYDASRTYYYVDGQIFSGTFDGAGKTISNLYVLADAGYAGLFGNVDGTLKNFTVTGSVTIDSTGDIDFVGGVSGKLSEGGTIQGVTSHVNVNAPDAFNVGGITGFNGTKNATADNAFSSADNTSIIECINYGEVIGYSQVGGIAGENAGQILRCANYCTVDALKSGSKAGIGGIAGRNGCNNTAYTSGTILDCYNFGTIGTDDNKWVGGIAGFNNAESSVINCYNVGTVLGTGQANAICGQNEATGDNTVTNCWYLDSTMVFDESGVYGGNFSDCGPKTEAEMKEPVFAAILGENFNVDDGQSLIGDRNGGYPVLDWMGGTEAPALYTVTLPESDETFVISTEDSTTVAEGGSFSFKVYVEDGYTINYVKANDTELTADGSTYTIENITSDVTVIISVKAIHEHSYEAVVTAPTCTEDGYTTYTCACGDSYTADETAALGHSYENGKCTVCGAADPDYVAPVTYAWYEAGAETGSYAISTAEELAQFAAIVNGTDEVYAQDNFSGKTVCLTADIVLAEDGLYKAIENVTYGSASWPMTTTQYVLLEGTPVWTPIGSGTASGNTVSSTANAFAGTFDGQNHTVSCIYTGTTNASAANTASVQGLFGIVSGTVKNVTVSGCITGNSVVGGVVAYLYNGTVENCVNNAIVFADGGTTPNGNAENGTSRAGATGGIVGLAAGTGSVTGCVNNATVICANTAKGGRVGGIVGLIDLSSDVISISKCVNKGEVEGYQYVAGIIGMNYASNSPVDRCVNLATITFHAGGKSHAGGIAGQFDCQITNCYNMGNIHSTHTTSQAPRYFGGIAGDYNYTTGSGKIINCYSTGTITYEMDSCSDAGIIVGESGYTTNSYFLDTALVNSGSGVSQLDGISKTEAELKAEAMITLLGDAFRFDSDSINGGYPVLDWQGGSEVVPHEHSYEATVTAPTCTEQGYTTYTCECGDSYTADETAALGHTEETVPGKAATCTETGLTDGVKCSVCGETLVEQEEIAALGHTEETVPGKAATCTETGLTDGVKCSVCGETLVEQEEIAALGHNFENGFCTECDAEDPDYEAPHEHSYTTVVTEPTCTEQGYTTYTCECGESYVSDYTDAHGHNVVLVESEPATCELNGYEYYACEYCGGEEYNIILEATGHDYEDGVCTVCGAENPDADKGWFSGWFDKWFGSWWGDDEEEDPTEPSEPETSEPTEPSEPETSEPTEPSEPEEDEDDKPIWGGWFDWIWNLW